MVALLVVVFNYRLDATGSAAVIRFQVGNVLYYVIGIALAFALKDNRAFCKYMCPITVPLKITTRFSLLKIRGDRAKCDECQACVRQCPMDIRIPDYTKQGQRVLSTECSVCQTCTTVCPNKALKLSFGSDLGGKELLRVTDSAD